MRYVTIEFDEPNQDMNGEYCVDDDSLSMEAAVEQLVDSFGLDTDAVANWEET